MTDPTPSRAAQQTARLAIRLGGKRRVSVAVTVTPGGLLAIGGLVSTILLSTAVLVRASVRTARPERAG